MAERTEEDALAGTLQVTVGGEPYTLRVLPWKVGSEWRLSVATSMSGYTPEWKDDDAAGSMDRMLAGPTEAMLEHVRTFDRAGVLPADLEDRIYPTEIKDAFERCCDAVDPFGELRRLAEEAFGGPARAVRQAMGSEIAAQLLRELSTSSLSTNGASATTASGRSGRPSSSSSAGRTRKPGSTASSDPAATRSQTGSPRATLRPG